MTLPSQAERRHSAAQAIVARRLPHADSLWWLVLVAAAFSAAQLLFVPPRMGLSWDEVVYVSQIGSHAPAAYFDAARSRGIPLLVMPVELLTSSVVALRVYLSLASGLGMFLAFLAWRRLRPAWMLALAGLMFGGLWAAQYWGPQAFPDEWIAFTALAATGCFLRAAERSQAASRQAAGPGPASPASPGPASAGPANRQADGAAGGYRGALAGLAVSVGLAALVRPLDAVFLTLALVVASLAVAEWRRWPLPAATIAGLLAGSAEWVIEAYVRFGGPLARLHAAGAAQGGFGLHLGVWAEFRALNGPTLCRPCAVGLRHPEISLWWLALPVLTWLGVLAARRAGRLRTSLLPALCGLAVATPYLVLISYAAPRFLLPAYALLAIPVADAIAGLVVGVRPDLRPISTGIVVVCLGAQLVLQHLVLDHEVGGTVAFHNDYSRVVADLRHLGIRPPCLIKGSQHIPVAYYAGCGSTGRPALLPGGAGQEPVVVLVRHGARPPGYARTWPHHALPGTRILNLVAYLEPR